MRSAAGERIQGKTERAQVVRSCSALQVQFSRMLASWGEDSVLIHRPTQAIAAQFPQRVLSVHST